MMAQLQQQIGTPEGLNRFLTQIEQQLDQFYGRAIEEAKKPPWQRANAPIGHRCR